MCEANSLEYWESRFSSGSWEENKGKLQTEYFADLIIRNVNPRVLHETNSMIDFGCALGQLCEAWRHFAGTNDIVGYDFSPVACEIAQKEFTNIQFSNTVPKRKFDVVVSSNFLEHVESPLSYLNRFANMAEMYIVVLCPYKNKVEGEHVSSMTRELFPDILGNFVKFQEKIIPPSNPAFWCEDQILVVYKRTR